MARNLRLQGTTSSAYRKFSAARGWKAKSFEAAQQTLVGIELMHMLRKGQMVDGVGQGLTAAAQFYALAA